VEGRRPHAFKNGLGSNSAQKHWSDKNACTTIKELIVALVGRGDVLYEMKISSLHSMLLIHRQYMNDRFWETILPYKKKICCPDRSVC